MTVATVQYIPVKQARAVVDLAQCIQCGRCIASSHQANNPVCGGGRLDAQLVVVGEAPGFQERRDGLPFIGQSGQLLWNELRQHGVSRSQTWVTNALLCLSDDNKLVSPKDLRACLPRLDAELEGLADCSTGARVILCLGNSAATSVSGQKRSMSELNGKVEWSETRRAFLAYAYHPAAVLRNPDLYQDFAYAVRVATEQLKTSELALSPEPLTWDVVTNPTELLTLIEQAHYQDVVVCDLETTGLDALADRILDVGLCWSRTHSVIIPRDAILANAAVWYALRDLLEGKPGASQHVPKFVGHNYKFDAKFLRGDLHIKAVVGGDTMLLHYCLDERSGGEGGGFHDLKTLSRKYCNAPAYAEGIDRSHMTAVEPDKRRQYQAYDLVYTYRLWERLNELAQDEPPSRSGFPMPMETHNQLLVRASNALVDIELRGIRIDLDKMKFLHQDYKQRIELARAFAQECAGQFAPKGKTFNPNSPVQVAQILYSPAPAGMGYTNLGSTNEEALHTLQRMDAEKGKPANPFMDAVLEYRTLLHQKSTYLEGITRRLVRGKADGTLYPSFLLHGTTSGRLSSRDPNVQNIPADSVIKELFIPRDGHVMVNADYRRLEVGVLAWYSRDPKLIVDFQAPDFHWNVAESVFPTITKAMVQARQAASLEDLEALCKQHDVFADFAQRQARDTERTDDPDVLFGWMKTRIRRQAKYVSFGIMYGEGPEALSSPEKGLGCSVNQAAGYIRAWKAAYGQATRFLNDQAMSAKRYRWVESASGRRRRFAYPATLATHIANEAMNHPIQSLASDICLMALVKLNESLPVRQMGNVLLSVHDSILCEVWSNQLEQAIEHIRETMTTILQDDEILFDVDIASGASWGNCH